MKRLQRLFLNLTGVGRRAMGSTQPPPARSIDDAIAHSTAIRDDMDSGRLPFGDLLPLTPNDCQIIGFVLQSFAYADFNARRALEVLDHLKGEGRSTPNRALRDAGVLVALRDRLSELPLPTKEIANVETALAFFDRLSVIRHTFAHWATKRHPSADVLIAMTFNEREAFRRIGHEPVPFTATFGVVPMPEVRSNLNALEKNEAFLASMTSSWWDRFMPPLNSGSG